MTKEDLERIERELAISLPKEYRTLMMRYPLPACSGNHDTELWDSASALIDENKQLRLGLGRGHVPWPEHFYFIGGGGDGCVHALNLAEPNTPVWWVEHRNLESENSQRLDKPFGFWAEEYLGGLREDLAGEGVDPLDSPEEREQIEAKNAWSGGLSRALAAAIGAAVLYALAVWVK